ncbi:MAG: hypothetical protein KC620_08535, partial [Myxococcales bacterium]|nr:hypothetical protein [Myxococcales bacterium]
PHDRFDLRVGAALLLVGLAPLAGLRPLAAAAEHVAARSSARGLPVDDARGWRRLWWLEHPAPPAEAPDAGVD